MKPWEQNRQFLAEDVDGKLMVTLSNLIYAVREVQSGFPVRVFPIFRRPEYDPVPAAYGRNM